MSPDAPTFEEDYHPHVPVPDTTLYIPGTHIETIRDIPSVVAPEHIVFDFDGTLSLVREGWIPVMTAMMVEILQQTSTDETVDTLQEIVSEFILRLNGKQTIYQMIQLAEEVRCRGGEPQDPLDYKHLYHERLMDRIRQRRESLRNGTVSPESLVVPHTFTFLDALQQLNVHLYLASGTDEDYVREEAELLGLNKYFGNHMYGAIDDYKTFSKQMVIEKILRSNHVDGSRLVGFGDGYVEIENIKSAGGIAVAVASDESGRSGRVDTWKRKRLIGVGADIVIPDYQDSAALIAVLWPGKSL